MSWKFRRKLNSTKIFYLETLCQLYRLTGFLSMVFDDFEMMVNKVKPKKVL